jgi:hypothetical protein
VRHNLGRGRQCAGHRSPGSTGGAGKQEKLCFTRSSEHRPSGDDWIREHTDAELDTECQRDLSRTDIRRADTVPGMVQARWQTGNSVGSGLVSVELLGMILARSQSVGHSGEVHRDVVRGMDGAVGRRQCQEGVVKGAGRGAALGVHRSGQDVGPREERLEGSQGTVRRRYSAGGRMWESGSLGQGSEEHVTGWSATKSLHPVFSIDWLLQ